MRVLCITTPPILALWYAAAVDIAVARKKVIKSPMYFIIEGIQKNQL